MESISQCNKLFREKTLHPLASVIDLSAPCRERQVRPDSYCVVVKTGEEARHGYGRRSCDFSAGTVLFSQPTKVVSLHGDDEHVAEGHIVLFHPSLLVGTPLGRHIGSYSFFKYRDEEALHVSEAELRDIDHVLRDIDRELRRGIDQYSATILSGNIELLLNYCLRFYHRQFIMRHDADDSEFRRFASLLDDYMSSGRVRRSGMPCGACRFSSQMGMSAAYLADLVREETGKSVTGYAQLRRVELAKQMILANRSSDAKIALTLGYASAAEFQQLFYKLTGLTTDEYRA